MAALAARYNRVIRPLYLPGNGPPEEWVYTVLEARTADYAAELGAPTLGALLLQLRQQFDNAADRPTNIIKARFATLADSLQRTPADIARRVGRLASESGELKVFADNLMQAVADWRSRAGA